MSSYDDDSMHQGEGQDNFQIRKDSQGNQAIFVPVWQNQNSHLNQSYLNAKQEQIRMHKTKINHLEKHLQDYDRNFESLYESLNLATESEKSIKKQLIDMRTTISHLRIENQSLSTHNQIISDKMKLVNISQIQTKNQLDYLQQQNELLKQRNQQLLYVVQSAPAQSAHLFVQTKSEDFQKAQATISILEEQLDAQKRLLDRAKHIIEGLQGSFQDKQSQCGNLSNQVQQLNMKNRLQTNKWEQQNKALKRKIQGLYERQAQLTSRGEQYAEQKLKHQSQIKKLKQRTKQLVTQLQQQRQKHQTLQKNIQDLENSVRQLKDNNQNLQRQKIMFQQQICAMKQKNIQQKLQLQGGNSILNGRIRELQLAMVQFKKKVQKATEQTCNQGQAYQMQQFRIRCNSLVKQSQNLQSQLSKQNKKSLNLQKRLSQNQNQITHLREMNQNLQSQLNQIRDKNSPLQIIEQKQNKIMHLLGQIQEYKKKCNDLTCQLQETNSTKGILKSQIQKLKKGTLNQEVQDQILQNQAKKGNSNQECRQMRADEEQIRQLNGRISKLQQQIDIQSQSRKQKDKTIKKLQKQIQVLQQINKHNSGGSQVTQVKKVQLSKKCQQCHQKDQRISQLQSYLNQSHDRISEMESQMQQKGIEVKRLAKQSQKGRKQVQRCRKQTQKIYRAHKQCQPQVQRLQSQLQSAQQQKQTIIQEINSIKEQKQRMEDQMRNLRTNIKQYSFTINRESIEQKCRCKDRYKDQLKTQQQVRIQLQVKVAQLQELILQLRRQLNQEQGNKRLTPEPTIPSSQLLQQRRVKLQLLKQNQLKTNQVNELKFSLNEQKNIISKLQNQISKLKQKQNHPYIKDQLTVIADRSLCKIKQQRQKQRLNALRTQNEVLNKKIVEIAQLNEQKFRLTNQQCKKQELQLNYKIKLLQREGSELRGCLQKKRSLQSNKQNYQLSNRKSQQPGLKSHQHPGLKCQHQSGLKSTDDTDYELSYQNQLKKLRRMIVSNQYRQQQRYLNSATGSLQDKAHLHDVQIRGRLKQNSNQQKQKVIHSYYQQQIRQILLELQNERRESGGLRQRVYRLQQRNRSSAKDFNPCRQCSVLQGQLLEFNQKHKALQYQLSSLNQQIHQMRLLNQHCFQQQQDNTSSNSSQMVQMISQLQLYKCQLKRFQKLIRQQQKIFQAKLTSKEQQVKLLQMRIQSIRLGKQREQYLISTFQTAEFSRDKSIQNSRSYASKIQQSRVKVRRFFDKTVGVGQTRQSSNSKHRPPGLRSSKITDRISFSQHATQ